MASAWARWMGVLVGLAIAGGVGVVYAPVRGFEFINMDDPDYVTRNPMVQGGLTWAAVVWAVTGTHARLWHPVSSLSHVVDWQLYGPWAGGHHLTSVALHAASGVLLFRVLQVTTARSWASAFAAMLFVFHPLRVESVAWVAERKDVLSVLLALLALAAHVRAAALGGAARRALVVVLGALAMAAKAMMVTLPAVLLLADVWPLERWRREPTRRLLVEAAAAHYREALRLRPDQPEAHNGLGLVLAEQGDLAAAVERYRTALALRPRYAGAAVNLANALRRAGRLDEAMVAYGNALEWDPELAARPELAAAWTSLGLALADQGRARDAERALGVAHHLRPDSMVAADALAWLLATSADPDVRDGAQAVALVEPFRGAGATPRLLDTLAAAYAEAGRFPDAVAAARRAIVLAEGAGDAVLATEVRERLGAYEAGRPFRSEPPVAGE